MTPRDRKYHHWVRILTGLYVLSLLIIWFMVLPNAGFPMNYVTIYSALSVVVLGLVVTMAVHQIAGRLVRGNLVVQIVLLMLSVYGIPLGIWGIRLLRRPVS
ncbi:MAG: hypothetical protein CVU59_08555 [Deltaproteobacteria bacterium HGW-Deltaproteobacteria-17]|nr:MAG: hypothetical protein CVU59_08555 [Deltaproteobacteria bacterium HGW-Deltaproteobacteria-17]